MDLFLREARIGLADKAYASKANRNMLRPSPRRDHGQSCAGLKAVRGRPAGFGKARQPADFKAPFPRRALFRHHKASFWAASLAFIGHDILDWPKHTPN